MKRFSLTSLSPTCKRLGSLLIMLVLCMGMGRAVAPSQEGPRNLAVSQLSLNQLVAQFESPRFLMPRIDVQIRNAGEYYPLQLFLALAEMPTACRSCTNSLLRATSAPPLSLPGEPYGMLPLPHGPPVLS